jgi:hypothetical protein
MLTPTIPFDYARLVATTDRLRKPRTRTPGSRTRRLAEGTRELG